jgi:hypothetical protein
MLVPAPPLPAPGSFAIAKPPLLTWQLAEPAMTSARKYHFAFFISEPV